MIERVTMSIQQWNDWKAKYDAMERTIAYYEGTEINGYSLKNDLVCKLGNVRESFSEEEIEEYAMICSPIYVVDAMVDKINKLESALAFYANEYNYDLNYNFNSIASNDNGEIARKALGIANE